MDALDALLSRRSIRSYTGDPVTRDQVKELLHYAVHACSAGDQQPWRFVVIDERALLDKVAEQHPHAGMLRQAPVAILVCGATGRLPFPGFWEQDCAAVTQYLLLAAHASGLGGVWLGLHPDPERTALMARLLNIPDEVVPFALVPIGVPYERPRLPERDHREWVRRNDWNEPFFVSDVDRLHP